MFLFHLSLDTKAPPFTARDTLKAWQEKNHPWLELSDVHRETTENIRVTVIPFYMGMRVGESDYIIHCAWSKKGHTPIAVGLDCAAHLLWQCFQSVGIPLME